MRSRTRHAYAAALAAAVGAIALVGCDSAPDPADVGERADVTAAALAEGLASGDLSDLDFTGVTAARATRDYAAVVDGLGDLAPQVSVDDVEEDGDAATATLTWSWSLTDDEEAWSYQAPTQLRRVGGTWSVVWEHQVVEPSLNGASVLELTAVAAQRGDITGARGLKLVKERPVTRVGIDRTLVGPGKVLDSARALAKLVGIDVAPFVKQVDGSGAKAFLEAIVYRKSDLPKAVVRGADGIRGAALVADDLALAPTKGFAAPILGSVGPVTAEMVKDDPQRYRSGDEAGLSGLQSRYDDQLHGTAGVVVDALGSDGKSREVFRQGGEAGKPLQITLDADLQRAAESLLADVGPASALVAIRPSDGAILAAANGPGNTGQNLATFGRYAPGSTFKAVSSLALLRNGVRPDTQVQCDSSVTVDGKRFENYDDYPTGALGAIEFRTAVANSCNTAFISQRGKLGKDDLADAAASLGLGVDHDLGFPAYLGSVELPSTETEGAADLIGQGTVLASPMAMAAVIASIQDGSLVVPSLVTSVKVDASDGVTPVSKAEAGRLRALLRGVVTSGSGRFLLDVPGPPVIAKTGTAEFQDDKGRLDTHAWMIGAQGDLAVAVFVDVGDSGSGTAGPILESFLRAAR